MGRLAQRQDQPDGDVERVRPDSSERFKDREIPERQVSDDFLDGNWDMTVGYDPTKETQQCIDEPKPPQMTRASTLDDRYDFQGLKLSIENAAGSTREWYDKDAGEKGETTMRFDYGYVRMSEGTDGDHVDVYVGPNRESSKVWVVNQMRKPEFTEFDEQKCMIGFDSEKEARDAYLQHYNDDRFLGEMFEMSFDDFKAEVLETRENGGSRLRPKQGAHKRVARQLAALLADWRHESTVLRVAEVIGAAVQTDWDVSDIERLVFRVIAAEGYDEPNDDALAVLAQVGAQPPAPAPAQAIQQADPEPEYDVGDEVMLKNTTMGLRKNDRGVVVGMQGTMVGIVFFNRPEAAMYVDKDLLKKAPPKKEEGGGGGWGGGWGKKKSVLELIGAVEADAVQSGGPS